MYWIGACVTLFVLSWGVVGYISYLKAAGSVCVVTGLTISFGVS